MSDEPNVSELPVEQEDATSAPIHAVICIDAEVYERLRAILRHLCVGLIDHTASLRLLTTTPQAESLTFGPVQIVLYEDRSWPLKARQYQRLLDALASRPPTVVHAMSAGVHGLAEAVAGEHHADLVYNVTGRKDVDAIAGSHHLPAAAPGEGLRHVICASQPLYDMCNELKAPSETNLSLIRLGLPCASEPTCFVEESRGATILCTAPFESGGGVGVLLQAIHKLNTKGLEFLTFLLGSGPEESRLRRLANDLGLGPTVVFAQPEDAVQRAMVGADVFVSPTKETALSVRSLQALAQGMAVVSVAGGVCDAYVNNRTAVVAGESTAPDLAAAIERMLADRALARRLAAGAIEHMRTHHTMSAMADKTAEVYRRMALNRATFKLPSQEEEEHDE